MIRFFSKRRVTSFVTAVAFTFIGFSAFGNADLAMVRRYFTIGEPVIEELGSTTTPAEFRHESLPVVAGISLDLLVNVGKFLWKIIQEGKPTIDLKTDFASALPQGTLTWHNLHNWQAPQSRSYGVSYKNGLGSEIVRFNYRINYTYGGRYEGKGRYLTNVAVIPSEIKVWWGYNLTAKVHVHQLINTGTKEDPIAGMQLVLSWKTGSILVRHSIGGDGAFTHFED